MRTNDSEKCYVCGHEAPTERRLVGVDVVQSCSGNGLQMAARWQGRVGRTAVRSSTDLC